MTSETTVQRTRTHVLPQPLLSLVARFSQWSRRPMLVDVGLTFALTKLLFYGAMLIAFAVVPEYSGTQYQIWHAPVSQIIGASWRWDSGWYASVIQHGYTVSAGESSIAFFPLFPVLVRLAIGFFSLRWMYLAGVVVTNVALLFAMFAIWLYAESYGGRALAQRTLYLLAIFPASFFFSVAYSESVYLLVIAWTLLFLRKDHFAAAGVTGFFAALARPPGLYVGIPFALEAWHRRSTGKTGVIQRAAWIALIPAGLATFMIYLWWKFDDPFLFLTAQGAWNHTRGFPLRSITDSIHQMIATEGTRIAQLMNVVNTSAAILALVLGIGLLRRNPSGGLFVLAGVLTPLTFPIEGAPSVSLARYVVVLFPMFIPLARWASRRPVMVVLTVIFVPVQILLAALFVRWYWII